MRELLTGCYDNKKTMRREVWRNGELIHFITAEAIRQETVFTILPWGSYADVPEDK